MSIVDGNIDSVDKVVDFLSSWLFLAFFKLTAEIDAGNWNCLLG